MQELCILARVLYNRALPNGAAASRLFFKHGLASRFASLSKLAVLRGLVRPGCWGAIKNFSEVIDAAAKNLLNLRSWLIGRGVEQSGSSSGS